MQVLYRQIVNRYVGRVAPLREPGCQLSRLQDRFFAWVGIANHDMRARHILDVQPDFVFIGRFKTQPVVLQIVFADQNNRTISSMEDLRLGNRNLALLFAFFVFSLDVSLLLELKSNLLNVAGIGQVDLAENRFKVINFFLRNRHLLVDVFN